jgi:hypothetical protein
MNVVWSSAPLVGREDRAPGPVHPRQPSQDEELWRLFEGYIQSGALGEERSRCWRTHQGGSSGAPSRLPRERSLGCASQA